MLTIISGFAALERDQIRERSIAGTQRLARAGTWLGGIVPFGYRKQGERNEAHLVIADDEIPDVGLSEAEVVRRIFRMAAVERKSCRCIADYMNDLGVPCAYERDSRLLLRGKRRERTSGIWRAGRIRNLIVNTTYKGVHEYGKRSKTRESQVIRREVPAIVCEDLWRKAQEALASNWLFGPRSARHTYLLRGLMKCQLCGLTFIGTCQTRPSGKLEFYYRCNGKHSARQLFGPDGKRCASKDLNGQHLDSLIWTDVESFLRNPGEVSNVLNSKLSAQLPDSSSLAARCEEIQCLLGEKQAQRDLILTLYRRGRIDDACLETQLDDIQAEEEALKRQRREACEARDNAKDTAATLKNAADLLRQLRTRLDQGLSWGLKRQLVETLVGGIEINVVGESNSREAVVTIKYRFNPLSVNCTDKDSWRRLALSVQGK
jgi:site-specific DNA recombinase